MPQRSRPWASLLAATVALHSIGAQPTVRPERATTRHSIVLSGTRIDYDATFGDVVLTDASGAPRAHMFFTAYTKRDVADSTRRPVMFAYNGGPGSASVMLHIGALGPRRIVLADTTHPGGPPYVTTDNAFSLLDKTDLVFVDPVGTGYSAPVTGVPGAEFWGVDEDVRSQAQFIIRWLNENHRWNSPRYLIGESYGTIRVVALADYLQATELTNVNGVILVSSALDPSTHDFGSDNALPYALVLPSYAAIAWYHHRQPDRPPDLHALLREVERFATTEYLQALGAGDTLSSPRRADIVNALHRYTGLAAEYWDESNLRVDPAHFDAELLRDRGLMVGRQDGRFVGPMSDTKPDRAPYDVSSAALFPAFVSTFNHYLTAELQVKTEEHGRYVFQGDVEPWDTNHRAPVLAGSGPGAPRPNVAQDLAEALNRDPRLRVLVHSGYFDLATPYFSTHWTLNHLGLSPDLRAHIREADYDAGHAMYVSEPALAQFKKTLTDFIDSTHAR